VRFGLNRLSFFSQGEGEAQGEEELTSLESVGIVIKEADGEEGKKGNVPNLRH